MKIIVWFVLTLLLIWLSLDISDHRADYLYLSDKIMIAFFSGVVSWLICAVAQLVWQIDKQL